MTRDAGTATAVPEGSGPDAGAVDRRLADRLDSRAPAASMADGQIGPGVEVFRDTGRGGIGRRSAGRARQLPDEWGRP